MPVIEEVFIVIVDVRPPDSRARRHRELFCRAGLALAGRAELEVPA